MCDHSVWSEDPTEPLDRRINRIAADITAGPSSLRASMTDYVWIYDFSSWFVALWQGPGFAISVQIFHNAQSSQGNAGFQTRSYHTCSHPSQTRDDLGTQRNQSSRCWKQPFYVITHSQILPEWNNLLSLHTSDILSEVNCYWYGFWDSNNKLTRKCEIRFAHLKYTDVEMSIHVLQ